MIREFRLLPRRDLEQIRAWLHSQLRAWSAEWLSGDADTVVTVAADPGVPGDWLQASVLYDNPDRWCALRVTPTSEPALAAVLFGTGGTSAREFRGLREEGGLCRGLLRDAIWALAGRVLACASSSLVEERVPDSAFVPGAGSVAFALTAGSVTVNGLLSAQTISDFLGDDVHVAAPAATLQRVADVIGEQTVRGECVLGDTQLPLASLASLAVGDVITVDQRVDEPLTIRFEDGAATCAGYLCERAGRDALMLIKRSANAAH